MEFCAVFVTSSNKQKKPSFEVLVRILARIHPGVLRFVFRYTQVYATETLEFCALTENSLEILPAFYSRFTVQNRQICQLFTNVSDFVSNYTNLFIISRLLIQEITNNLYKLCSHHLIIFFLYIQKLSNL